MEKMESLELQRARCEGCLDDLRKLTRIHTEIDSQERRIAPDEPDWIVRLRKVYFHVIAITDCEISADGIHIMTAELRAAFEQMGILWKCLPQEFRPDENHSWWTEQARGGLAKYTHPTMMSVILPLMSGGFGEIEVGIFYLKTVEWLGRLIGGYTLVLGYLAQILGAESDVTSRLLSVLDNSIP